MEHKDLSPEDQELIKKIMSDSKAATNSLLGLYFIFLFLLCSMNFVICKFMEVPKECIVMMDILTGILIGSSCMRQLINKSEHFVEEIRKVIKK